MSRKRAVGFDNADVAVKDDTETKNGGSAKKPADEKASGALGKDAMANAVDSNYPPSAARRSTLQAALGTRGPLPGIKNLGATCYINSLLQSLFMTPELRKHVLEWAFDPKQQHSQNLAYQLQLLFHLMTHPRRGNVDAKALIDSFGMGSAAYRQQHDVQELNRQLLDVIQTFIDRAGSSQVLRHLYEGQFKDYKRCTTCFSETSAPSPYQDLSVAIQEMPTLEAALQNFVKPDVIEGVTCDTCEEKRTVEKGLAFKSFPRILTIQLLRMDYNRTTFEREKVKQDVKLPLTLDVAQLLANDGRDSDGAPTKYYLQTVIAHSGTAYFGHYYVFSRVSILEKDDATGPAPESGADATDATVGGKWIKFNDENISFASPEAVEEYIDPAAWKARGVAKAKQRMEDDKAKKDAANTDQGVDASDSAATTQPAVLKPQPPEDVMGMPAASDDALIADLFGGGDAASDSKVYEKTPGGSSYYAIYRRCDLQQVTEMIEQDFQLPQYVVHANREPDELLDKDAAELAALREVVPVGLVYRGVKQWVDCRASTTIANLTLVARQVFKIDDALFARLRAYSSTLGTMGATYDPTVTLESIGATSSATSFSVFGLETTTSEHLATQVWPNQKITEWDNKMIVRVHNPEKNTFSDLRDFERQAAAARADTVQDATTAATPDAEAPFEPFTFPANATIAEVLLALSLRTQIPLDDLDACFIARASATPLRVDAATGAPRDLDAPFASMPASRESDVLLVERRSLRPTAAPDVITVPHPWLMLNGFIYAEMGHVIHVNVKYHGDKLAEDAEKTSSEPVAANEDDDGSAAGGQPTAAPPQQVEEFVVPFDGRKMLHELKAAICDRLRLRDGDVQMFIDNARREPTTLLSTVRSTAFGMKKLTVNVVNGAPLGGDEAYVEVYVATNRTTPVVQFLSKALIRIGTATVADVVGQALRHPKAASLGLDTSDARLCRARLMPPMRSSALGVPMLKPKIKDNMTSHSIDELRIVLQPLDVPEASPLTKSSLILTLHTWDSRNPDPATALGPRREIVTAKDAPVKDLVLAACRLLDVDPPKAALLPTPADDGSKKADKDTPKVEEPQPEASDVAPPIEFAKARTYLLTDHKTVATRLPWGLIDVTSVKDLSKHLGGFPLRLEQDDIIVVRRPTDPWPDGISQQYGSVVGGSIVVTKKKIKGAKEATSANESGGTNRSKSRRDEPGLALRAVWDSIDEPVTVTTGGADQSAGAEPLSDVTKPDAVTATAAASSCGNVMEKLPSIQYSKAMHAELEETCAVCMGELEEKEDVVVIPSCHHLFHQDCLAPWANSHGTCPKCLNVIIVGDD
jgi:hypothetical protein